MTYLVAVASKTSQSRGYKSDSYRSKVGDFFEPLIIPKVKEIGDFD